MGKVFIIDMSTINYSADISIYISNVASDRAQKIEKRKGIE